MLRPNPEHVKVSRESVVYAYRAKFNDSLALRDNLERELRHRREDKWKLNEAYVYRGALGEEDYRQMKKPASYHLLTKKLRHERKQSASLLNSKLY